MSAAAVSKVTGYCNMSGSTYQAMRLDIGGMVGIDGYLPSSDLNNLSQVTRWTTSQPTGAVTLRKVGNVFHNSSMTSCGVELPS